MRWSRVGSRWARQGLFTPRWVAVHVAVLVLVAAFLGLGWWQFGRAAAGNVLSFGYAIQWPAFAAFVVWVWLAEMRKVRRAAGTAVDPGRAAGDDDPSAAARPGSTGEAATVRRPRNEAAYDDSDDPELAAYNHYLAWLNAHPHASPADYPGPPQSKELHS